MGAGQKRDRIQISVPEEPVYMPPGLAQFRLRAWKIQGPRFVRMHGGTSPQDETVLPVTVYRLDDGPAQQFFSTGRAKIRRVAPNQPTRHRIFHAKLQKKQARVVAFSSEPCRRRNQHAVPC